MDILEPAKCTYKELQSESPRSRIGGSNPHTPPFCHVSLGDGSIQTESASFRRTGNLVLAHVAHSRTSVGAAIKYYGIVIDDALAIVSIVGGCFAMHLALQ